MKIPNSICVYVKLEKCKVSCSAGTKHKAFDGCCKIETQKNGCPHMDGNVVFCVPLSYTKKKCKELLLEATLRKNFLRGHNR